MSAKKSAKKVVKETSQNTGKKTTAKKAVTKPAAKKAVNKVAKNFSASKDEIVTKTAKKKVEAAPLNVIPLPGKLARLSEKYGPGALEYATKLAREHGPAVAYKVFDKATKRFPNPLAKAALGLIRDFAHDYIKRQKT
jgi:hypothetical protein